ncbi:MAG: hypothetical protein WCG25_01235 [bacterium]
MSGYCKFFSLILDKISSNVSHIFIKIVCGVIISSNFSRSLYLLVHANQLSFIHGLIFEKKKIFQDFIDR